MAHQGGARKTLDSALVPTPEQSLRTWSQLEPKWTDKLTRNTNLHKIHNSVESQDWATVTHAPEPGLVLKQVARTPRMFRISSLPYVLVPGTPGGGGRTPRRGEERREEERRGEERRGEERREEERRGEKRREEERRGEGRGEERRGEKRRDEERRGETRRDEERRGETRRDEERR